MSGATAATTAATTWSFDVSMFAPLYEYHDQYWWAHNEEWPALWLRHAWEHWRAIPVRDYAFAPVYVDDDAMGEMQDFTDWYRLPWPRALWEGRTD